MKLGTSAESYFSNNFFTLVYVVNSGGRNGTKVNNTVVAPSNDSSTSGCLSRYYYNGESFTTSVITSVLLSAVFL